MNADDDDGMMKRVMMMMVMMGSNSPSECLCAVGLVPALLYDQLLLDYGGSDYLFAALSHAWYFFSGDKSRTNAPSLSLSRVLVSDGRPSI